MSVAVQLDGGTEALSHARIGADLGIDEEAVRKAGLRVSELVELRVTDLDSKNRLQSSFVASIIAT